MGEVQPLPRRRKRRKRSPKRRRMTTWDSAFSTRKPPSWSTKYVSFRNLFTFKTDFIVLNVNKFRKETYLVLQDGGFLVEKAESHVVILLLFGLLFLLFLLLGRGCTSTAAASSSRRGSSSAAGRHGAQLC